MKKSNQFTEYFKELSSAHATIKDIDKTINIFIRTHENQYIEEVRAEFDTLITHLLEVKEISGAAAHEAYAEPITDLQENLKKWPAVMDSIQ